MHGSKKFKFPSCFFVFVLKGMCEHAAPGTKYFQFESYDFSLKISDSVSLYCNCLKYILYGPLHKVVVHAVISEVEMKVMNTFL